MLHWPRVSNSLGLTNKTRNSLYIARLQKNRPLQRFKKKMVAEALPLEPKEKNLENMRTRLPSSAKKLSSIFNLLWKPSRILIPNCFLMLPTVLNEPNKADEWEKNDLVQCFFLVGDFSPITFFPYWWFILNVYWASLEKEWEVNVTDFWGRNCFSI